MSRTSLEIGQTAVVLALLVAASPLREHSPNPINGVRTALELIAKKRSVASHRDVPFVPAGTV